MAKEFKNILKNLNNSFGSLKIIYIFTTSNNNDAAFSAELKINIMKDTVEVTQGFGDKRVLTISRRPLGDKNQTVRYQIRLLSEVTKKNYELPYLTREDLSEILRRVDEIEKFATE